MATQYSPVIGISSGIPGFSSQMPPQVTVHVSSATGVFDIPGVAVQIGTRYVITSWGVTDGNGNFSAPVNDSIATIQVTAPAGFRILPDLQNSIIMSPTIYPNTTNLIEVHLLSGPGGKCLPGETRCNDINIEQCVGGEWIASHTCSGTCSNGNCIASPNCSEGATRCNANGTSTDKCVGGKWINMTSCINGCANGKCNAPPNVQCSSGDKRCSADGNYPEYCINGTWDSIIGSNCKYGCSNGNCNPNPNVCENGAKRCGANGLSPEVCINNQWVTGTPCGVTSTCKDGVCVSNMTCPEGQTQCSSDGKFIERCSQNEWHLDNYCSAGCKNGVCNQKGQTNLAPVILVGAGLGLLYLMLANAKKKK